MKPSVEDWRAMRLQAKGATFAAKGFGRAVYPVVGLALVAGGWALAHVMVLVSGTLWPFCSDPAPRFGRSTISKT
jgi:hypothetical protein